MMNEYLAGEESITKSEQGALTFGTMKRLWKHLCLPQNIRITFFLLLTFLINWFVFSKI